MITFKQFLLEGQIDFDMTDMSKKEEGRKKLCAMTDLDIEEIRPYFKKATASNVVSAYNDFTSNYPVAAAIMNNSKPDGVGPGEVIFYFVFDNVGVGGKNSPIDLYLNGNEWAEAKAGVLSTDKISDFKISKDGAKAVSDLLKDFDNFNSKYHDITGEDLPNFRTAGTVATSALKSWTDIDLEALAKESTGGPKKQIDLVLKKDGDLIKKGDDDDRILNVNTDKSVKPLTALISGDEKIKLSAEDKKISTLEKILARWVDGVFDEYLDGKKIALISTKSKSTRLVFFGTLKKEQLGLLRTHRNQPWAEIYISGQRPTLDTKVEAKEKKSSAEDIGRSLRSKK